MNVTDTDRSAEIGAYAAAVRAALADVPPGQGEELLEDLEEHLAEVAADGDAPLTSRLGPPEEYARELRAAAGLPAGGAAAGRHGTAAWIARARSSRPVVELARFLPELRPAWWVVRAWAPLTAVELLFVGGGSFPLPTLGLGVVGMAATVAAVVWSVRLGLRSRAAGRPPGPAAILLNGSLAVLTLVAVVGFAAVPPAVSAEPVYYDEPQPAELRHEDGTPITNIHPYSPDGEPLTGVRLYDQDGRPIDNLADYTAEGDEVVPVPDTPPQLGNVFPQQRQVLTWDERGERIAVPLPVPADPGPATAEPSAPETPSTGKRTGSPPPR